MFLLDLNRTGIKHFIPVKFTVTSRNIRKMWKQYQYSLTFKYYEIQGRMLLI